MTRMKNSCSETAREKNHPQSDLDGVGLEQSIRKKSKTRRPLGRVSRVLAGGVKRGGGAK